MHGQENGIVGGSMHACMGRRGEEGACLQQAAWMQAAQSRHSVHLRVHLRRAYPGAAVWVCVPHQLSSWLPLHDGLALQSCICRLQLSCSQVCQRGAACWRCHHCPRVAASLRHRQAEADVEDGRGSAVGHATPAGHLGPARQHVCTRSNWHRPASGSCAWCCR